MQQLLHGGRCPGQNLNCKSEIEFHRAVS
jgi:hypothetical protein